MKEIATGQFFGQTDHTWKIGPFTATETAYTEAYVDWHYHENMYVTFLLAGGMTEGHRKENYRCRAGTLLFHHWQDPHYNTDLLPNTRGFHLEIKPTWMAQWSEDTNHWMGSFRVENPQVKLDFYQVLQDIRLARHAAQPSLEAFILKNCVKGQRLRNKSYQIPPVWVKKVRTFLHDDLKPEFSLQSLAADVCLHPVHLSREFPKYFGCSFSAYRRKLRIAKSLSLLLQREYSLTNIAFQCGFADQSHFLRSFKAVMGQTPSYYRKQILGPC